MIFAKFISFVLTISAIALVAVAAPLEAIHKREALNVAVCTDRSVKLVSHDCNVALLRLGGGIAGAIQFLRVNGPTSSGTSGTCTVTTTTTDGGNLDISKGRLEGHGSSNGGYDNLLDACGSTPGSMIIGGGSKGGGNVKVTISKAK